MVWPSEFEENRTLVKPCEFFVWEFPRLSVCLMMSLEHVRVNLQVICICRFLKILFDALWYYGIVGFTCPL